MEHLLSSRIPIMEEILDITRQPGISIGVIHEGIEVFKHNLGVMNVDTGLNPDSDTLYCIASLSKAFMVASLDLLVREQPEEISWDSTIESIVPEFKHVQSPTILSTLTSKDILSHRSGLLSLDEITQGLDARILVPKKDVIKVINALPVKFDVRSGFLYNNASYELAGHIFERISEPKYANWGDFQRDRIYRPLRITRTTAFGKVHQTDNNIVTPYMTLTDGSPYEIPPTELSADSINGGPGGLRSSVNDLLKLCMNLLRSFSDETADGIVIRWNSPMFNRSVIANPESA